MEAADLHRLIAQITARIAGRPLDASLQDWLNQEFGTGTTAFAKLQSTCEAGVAEGWLCQREAGGIRYGRVFKPDGALHGFSVDVVEMDEVAGPHHSHPNGEIDLILPRKDSARFDGHPAGWLVYGPGSAHCPTVCGGSALVLYLLPEGAITFTKPPAKEAQA